jgi:hypothetical protein
VAHGLEELLDLHNETDVKDGCVQLDVTKVTGAGLDIFLARGARVHAVDSAELGVIETLLTRFLLLLVHGLRVDDVDDTHGLDLLGREQPELDLLDGPERTFRHLGRARRHAGGSERVLRVRGSLETCLAVDGRGGHAGRFLRVLSSKLGCRGSYVDGCS